MARLVIAELTPEAHAAELHAALAQAALAQAALAQAAELQAAELHAASEDTASAQAAESNTDLPVVGSVDTNVSRFSFGFGGVKSRLDAIAASTSPTPADCQSAFGRYAAVSMRAPFT